MEKSKIKAQIKEFVISDITSFVNHYKMQKILQGEGNKDGNFSYINFSADYENSKNVASISGWKNYDFAIIESIWVHKNFQKMNIGIQLVDNFIEKSKFLKCCLVIATVHNYSAAEGFWKKCGFKEFADLNTPQTTITYLRKNI